MATHFFSKSPRIRGWYNEAASVKLSEHFYDFMDRKVVTLFKLGTGLSPSAQITITMGSQDRGIRFYEVENELSRINIVLYIADGIGHEISFCWKSKSGKLISIGDEEFDEDDLECWMEGLTPEKYYKELTAEVNKRLPFKMKNLPFELEVRNYAYTMHLYITVNEKGLFNSISETLNHIFVKFNQVADERERGKNAGLILQAVHNWKIELEKDGRLLIYIDAASPEILKNLMKGLARYQQVTRVEMDLCS